MEKEKSKKDSLIKNARNAVVLLTVVFTVVGCLTPQYSANKGNPVILENPAIPGQGFVKIAGGKFLMGLADADLETDDEKKNNNAPQHTVIVSDFYMCSYEVTQREYVAVMGFNPSSQLNPELPVDCVSWYDAINYCNALSAKEELTPVYEVTYAPIDNPTVKWNRNANGYRLPTEAEWEYACRAGTKTKYYTGKDVDIYHANYNDPKKFGNRGHVVIGGSYQPNPFGLYDMMGNVYEWCWDWWGDYPDDNPNNPPKDPAGPDRGTWRTMRSSFWGFDASVIRSGHRDNGFQFRRSVGNGFRVVRNG
jgi:formylglycine-generating enzyme required for sulfatase activity